MNMNVSEQKEEKGRILKYLNEEKKGKINKSEDNETKHVLLKSMKKNDEKFMKKQANFEAQNE